MSSIWLGLVLLSLGIWVGLLCFRGQFWRSDQVLEPEMGYELEQWPTVCAIVPARNEASLLPETLRSLLSQDYPGQFKVILVDDQSTDGTGNIARETSQVLNRQDNLQVLTTEPLPPGWSGKLWAVEQGIQHVLSETEAAKPDYLLLTDADIVHAPDNLRQLVTKAQQEKLDLVSLMVLLRCESFWEQFLIPAFVFFFQKLYPFRWVNNPQRQTAAAAGGCILVQQKALARAGGIAAVQHALIDDCALAAAVKSTGHSEPGAKGQLWLGLTSTTHSLRVYDTLNSIWEMVARTAFTQLYYSPWLLLGTLVAMFIIYLVPVLGIIVGLLSGNALMAIAAAATWLLMTVAYLPTIRLYRLSPLWALTLPAIAALYSLMTLDSAWRHWRGKGGAWKGRVYSIPS